jgi:hypothetical protein
MWRSIFGSETNPHRPHTMREPADVVLVLNSVRGVACFEHCSLKTRKTEADSKRLVTPRSRARFSCTYPGYPLKPSALSVHTVPLSSGLSSEPGPHSHSTA